jgi:Cu/Ag efflux pump CusA
MRFLAPSYLHLAWLALIPLALRGDAPGSEILTPMAVVILWGLLSSTLLNMLLVPALFLRFAIPAETGEELDMPMEVTGAEA